MFDSRTKIMLFCEVRFVSALPIRNTLFQFSKSTKKTTRIKKSHPIIDKKTTVAKIRPSETNFIDFWLIWGPFLGQNQTKKQSKTVLIFDRKKGSEKEGEMLAQRSSGDQLKRTRGHFWGRWGRWGEERRGVKQPTTSLRVIEVAYGKFPLRGFREV